ncbi:MAG TPA: diguanylate cyclase [Spirochaetota bacterium]|nr:diguanylate cyclase [Spirochaetota bacterium]HNT12806.1 diguanylate cyclase [Spirochaetota bacterium]
MEPMTASSLNAKPLILIVDDAPKNLQVLGTMLDERSYEVAVASNGAQAISLLSEIRPDLILLDVMMPVMDGFQTCRMIKESPETRDIPVIFLTARDETESIITGFRLGAVDYITKPFSSYELLARVDAHVELKRCRDNIVECNNRLNLEIEYRKQIAHENEALLNDLLNNNRRLENLAVTDSLTGLYNHNVIIDRLEGEVNMAHRYQTPLSVIMFDVDHFKRINDTYGHLIGDEVLVRISSVMRNRLRRVDVSGRYGGEEFLVILPHTEMKNGYFIADKLRKAVKDQQWSRSGLEVTISGGIAEFSDENPRDLIEKADRLLYKAKEHGRNRIEFN